MASDNNFGRYVIKHKLGQGGMATVYLAQDPRFGRDVALKVLPRQFLHDAQFRERFEREARTIAKLEHKAIVPVYDFGEHDGQPYLVMRYMPGGSLESRIKKGGPLPLNEIVTIVQRIASALDEAHRHGIVHRDLKPGNILFDQHGDAYLSDFGIVKVTEATANLTGNAIVGTPAYMSPEQVHGRSNVDGRSDIYTLGVILFELLVGRIPYPAETPTQMMMAHVLEPVPKVVDIAQADLPPSCEAVVQQAMAKEPDKRYQTAGALAGALKDASEGRGWSREDVLQTAVTPVPDAYQATTPIPIPSPTGGDIRSADPFGAGTAHATPQPTMPAHETGSTLAGKGGKWALWGCGAPVIAGLSLIGLCVLALIGGGIYVAMTQEQATPTAAAASVIGNLGSGVVDEEPTPIPATPTVEAEPTEEPQPTETVPPPTEVVEPTAEIPEVDPTNLLFEATFNRIGNWPSGDIKTTDDAGNEIVGALIGVEDGVYRFEAQEPQTFFWVTAGEEFEGGVYELEATAVDGPLDNGFGMLLMVDPDTDDFYKFEISSDGYVWIGRCTNGCEEVDRFISDEGWVQSDAVAQGLGATNKLTVIAADGNLTFFVNGVEVLNYFDDTLTTGDIGLFVDTFDTGNVLVNFDNFRYTSLEAAPDETGSGVDPEALAAAEEHFPIPDDATNLFSLGTDDEPSVMFQTETSLEDITALYREMAADGGLTEVQAVTGEEAVYLEFTDPDNSYTVTVIAAPTTEGTNSVILNININ